MPWKKDKDKDKGKKVKDGSSGGGGGGSASEEQPSPVKTPSKSSKSSSPKNKPEKESSQSKKLMDARDEIEYLLQEKMVRDKKLEKLTEEKEELKKRLARYDPYALDASKANGKSDQASMPFRLAEDYEALCSNEWFLAKRDLQYHLQAEDSLLVLKFLCDLMQESCEATKWLRLQVEDQVIATLLHPTHILTGDAIPALDMSEVERELGVRFEEVVKDTRDAITVFLNEHSYKLDTAKISSSVLQKTLAKYKQELPTIFDNPDLKQAIGNSRPLRVFINKTCALMWRMRTQKTPLDLRSHVFRDEVFDEGEHEMHEYSPEKLMQGRSYAVDLFIIPGLYHGESCLRRGQVFIQEIPGPPRGSMGFASQGQRDSSHFPGDDPVQYNPGQEPYGMNGNGHRGQEGGGDGYPPLQNDSRYPDMVDGNQRDPRFPDMDGNQRDPRYPDMVEGNQRDPRYPDMDGGNQRDPRYPDMDGNQRDPRYPDMDGVNQRDPSYPDMDGNQRDPRYPDMVDGNQRDPRYPDMMGDPRDPRYPDMDGDPRALRYPDMVDGNHRDPRYPETNGSNERGLRYSDDKLNMSPGGEDRYRDPRYPTELTSLPANLTDGEKHRDEGRTLPSSFSNHGFADGPQDLDRDHRHLNNSYLDRNNQLPSNRDYSPSAFHNNNNTPSKPDQLELRRDDGGGMENKGYIPSPHDMDRTNGIKSFSNYHDDRPRYDGSPMYAENQNSVVGHGFSGADNGYPDQDQSAFSRYPDVRGSQRHMELDPQRSPNGREYIGYQDQRLVQGYRQGYAQGSPML